MTTSLPKDILGKRSPRIDHAEVYKDRQKPTSKTRQLPGFVKKEGKQMSAYMRDSMEWDESDEEVELILEWGGKQERTEGNNEQGMRQAPSSNVQKSNNVENANNGRMPTTTGTSSVDTRFHTPLKITIPPRLISNTPSSQRAKLAKTSLGSARGKPKLELHSAELDSSGLNGSYWSSTPGKARRRGSEGPPLILYSHLKRPQTPNIYQIQSPASTDAETDFFDSDDSDFVAPSSRSSRSQMGRTCPPPQRAPSPIADILPLEEPSDPPRNDGVTTATFDVLSNTNVPSNMGELLEVNPSLSNDARLPPEETQGTPTVPVTEPPNPLTPLPTPPPVNVGVVQEKSTLDLPAMTGNPSDPPPLPNQHPDPTNNPSRLEHLIADRDRLLSANAELTSSLREMRLNLEAQTSKIKNLEERLRETNAEMEFAKHSLEWEKKKTEKDKFLMQTEREFWAKEKEKRGKERDDKEAFNLRLKTLEEEKFGLEREVAELKTKLVAESRSKSLGNAAFATPHPPPPRDGQNDHHGPSSSPPRPELVPPVSPPAGSVNKTCSNDLCSNPLKSLALTEVTSWSTMLVLLHQAESVVWNDDLPKRSRQALMEKMVGLCKEREKFLFDFFGILSLGLHPINERSTSHTIPRLRQASPSEDDSRRNDAGSHGSAPGEGTTSLSSTLGEAEQRQSQDESNRRVLLATSSAPDPSVSSSTKPPGPLPLPRDSRRHVRFDDGVNIGGEGSQPSQTPSTNNEESPAQIDDTNGGSSQPSSSTHNSTLGRGELKSSLKRRSPSVELVTSSAMSLPPRKRRVIHAICDDLDEASKT